MGHVLWSLFDVKCSFLWLPKTILWTRNKLEFTLCPFKLRSFEMDSSTGSVSPQISFMVWPQNHNSYTWIVIFWEVLSQMSLRGSYCFNCRIFSNLRIAWIDCWKKILCLSHTAMFHADSHVRPTWDPLWSIQPLTQHYPILFKCYGLFTPILMGLIIRLKSS